MKAGLFLKVDPEDVTPNECVFTGSHILGLKRIAETMEDNPTDRGLLQTACHLRCVALFLEELAEEAHSLTVEGEEA